MLNVKANCSACGMAVEREVAEPFAGAELVAVHCPDCTDRQALDGGGAILALCREPERSHFPLGKVTITGGAVAALAEAGEHAASFLVRHVRGVWGAYGNCDAIELTADERRRGWEATDGSGKINKSNLLSGYDA